jgi:hypothetical protein
MIEVRKHKESSIMDLFVDKKYVCTFFFKEELDRWMKRNCNSDKVNKNVYKEEC